MPRAARSPASRRRRKKILARAKGFRGRRKNVYRVAKQAVMRAEQFAYGDRRRRKRDFRRLWIVRINAACRERGLTYGTFVAGLKRASFEVNRKVLADIAAASPDEFSAIVDLAKRHA